jgi:hypothetical protein
MGGFENQICVGSPPCFIFILKEITSTTDFLSNTRSCILRFCHHFITHKRIEMKEPDEGKTTQLQPLTIGQAAEFVNIREVKEPIGAFAANAKGVKALKQLYKTTLDGFKKYLQATNGDRFPGLALVFHKSKDQLSV